MFFRLLMESFRRQRRRKLLAGLAILLGTTAVTAMLALATTIGDRIHNELAVYGANIIVYPAADQLEVKVGGVDIKPVSGGAYLHESDLAKLRGIFWANNITGVSPELPAQHHRQNRNRRARRCRRNRPLVRSLPQQRWRCPQDRSLHDASLVEAHRGMASRTGHIL